MSPQSEETSDLFVQAVDDLPSEASGARRRKDESPQGQDNGEYCRAWFTTAGPPGHAKDSPNTIRDEYSILGIVQFKRQGGRA